MPPKPIVDPVEFALKESDRMMILASQARQDGFVELSRWLLNNSEAARRWALSQMTSTQPNKRKTP